MRIALLALALAACDPIAHEPRPCDDGPSLHVVVDLSDPSCAGVTPSYASIDFAGSSVVSTTRTFEDLTPPIVEYEYAWPSQVADGVAIRVAWYGLGADSRSGFGALDATAHPSTCEVVEVPVRCGIFVEDARP